MKNEKTIYITESTLNSVKDKIMRISKSLPESFYTAASKGKFPFTPNPAFPEIMEDNFVLSILKKVI